MSQSFGSLLHHLSSETSASTFEVPMLICRAPLLLPLHVLTAVVMVGSYMLMLVYTGFAFELGSFSFFEACRLRT